jgi:hypothetical protein
MKLKQIGIGIWTLACVAGAAMLLSNVVQAQDSRVATAMQLLESGANK